jgi:hypothetical protein
MLLMHSSGVVNRRVTPEPSETIKTKKCRLCYKQAIRLLPVLNPKLVP